MKKACVLSFVLCAMPFAALEAQQITRFAIVDMARVYAAFSGSGNSAQALDNQAKKVQDEIDKRKIEIEEMISRHAEALQAKVEAEIKRLATEIERKKAALKSYYDTETKKLEDAQMKQPRSADFADKVYNAVRVAAESEGYSMVLNLQNSKGMIVWYSQAIDITDKVIAYLRKSSR